MSWRLIFDLLHRRAWLLGMGGMVLAYVLQAVALGFGNVALVEPIVATELLFAVPLAIRMRHQRATRREWLGVLAVAGGVAAFLIAAEPSGSNPHPPYSDWILVLVPAIAAIAVLLAVSRGPQTRGRAMLLGAAAGIANGMVALVTKSFTTVITHGGIGNAFASWQLYTIFAFGAAGFLFAQSAYQAAPLADSLPVMDSLEPLSSVVLAAGILGERVNLHPAHVVVEFAGALFALAGVVVLGRSPLVLSIYEQQQRRREEEGSDERPHAGNEVTPAEDGGEGGSGGDDSGGGGGGSGGGGRTGAHTAAAGPAESQETLASRRQRSA